MSRFNLPDINKKLQYKLNPAFSNNKSKNGQHLRHDTEQLYFRMNLVCKAKKKRKIYFQLITNFILLFFILHIY